MRTPLLAANLCLTAILCLALAACRKDAPQDTSADAAVAAAGEVAATPPASAGTAADTALQGDVIASTNEPFWHAQASGPVLTLRGIESERQLAISTNDVAGDTRTLRASDANGLVELKIVARECQDTMAGASFPYTAVLVIDGGTPVNGCARPASMPPPGEPR
ncbi:hypothetical protein [Pseudoxanthomonas daejeonensis]|uniref:Lipoprotein n=1 Tax=Pseudoxanthomonas daejeonensis TaxID=266062 RepID=A0ABQ6Z635_9GAMM|nr:hypothetical protein [Pseudoxanthomonas daejeonensis]KAF1694010.1 hypothetical protein CSC65_10130 [Pseudoxanthomonas daejeonensis]